jgi:phenylalanyl-tRNA synthetase beta chain
MKISVDWLNSCLDRPIDADEAERVLTSVGFPIDGAEPRGGDTILEVEVTSNRPDVLSHWGVAREIAAATSRGLKLPAITAAETGAPVQSLVSVDNQATDVCPLYTARVITGVTIGPSPRWLADRIESIGLRPVNNVVDATNFVLHETGHPLHAFDLAKLQGRRIVVRRAGAGEEFAAIDGSRHKLKSSMLVIADGQRPQAMAGIMGGRDSEVTGATTDLLLEAAVFDPLCVRSTSRALKLSSDSSYRFERLVDRGTTDTASRRAAQLILETAGGRLARGVITTGTPAAEPRRLTLRPERCRAILGIDLPTSRMLELLGVLQLEPRQVGQAIECAVPSWRRDVEREIDLIEEITRLHGFDQIPVQPAMRLVVRPVQPSVQARRAAARVLTAHGYFEAITFSNLPRKWAQPFAQGVELVELDEEKKKAEPALRPSLLPSLLACRKSNQDAGNRGVRLFEVAQTFGRRDGQYVEGRKLAMLADAPDAAEAMRLMRGTIEELGRTLGMRKMSVAPAASKPAWASAAAALTGDSNGKLIGVYGPAADTVVKLFDLQTPVVLAELDYAALIADYPPAAELRQLPRFPAIERDLSVIVDEATAWASIESLVRQAKPERMEQLEFVTVYRGKPVPAGRKSVTLRLIFRDPQRTLEHAEANAQVESVVQSLKQGLNAELRLG